MGTSILGFKAAANRCRSSTGRVPARMGVDEVHCRVFSVGGNLVTAEVVGMTPIKISQPLRVDNIDRLPCFLEVINESKAGHLAEVEKRFGRVATATPDDFTLWR